jgi:hypothetical protein
MASWKTGVLVSAFVAAVVCAGAAAASKFDGVVQPSWANDHVLYEDDLLKLRLDSSSGKLQTPRRFSIQRGGALFRMRNVLLLLTPCFCIWVLQAGDSRPRTSSCMARPRPI